MALLAFVATPTLAANWLMLQGTEPAEATTGAKFWGFLQPEFQSTSGSRLRAGPWADGDALFNQIAPDLDNNNELNLRRARLGLRASHEPLGLKVNYFLLAEFGKNGITNLAGIRYRPKVTDASVTFNDLLGLRVRIGQFKYPGAEEGLQAIHVFDYVNFTNVTNQLLLERFFEGDGSGSFVNSTPGPRTAGDSGNINKPQGSVGAFRDVGVQLFNTIQVEQWEHSFAFMVGNGNGIGHRDSDGRKDVYFYWASERLLGGNGPRRNGWKFLIWYQSGDRKLKREDVLGKRHYDRRRLGFGTVYRGDSLHFGAEYIDAEGMIFTGTDGGAEFGRLSALPSTALEKFVGNTDVGNDGQVSASFNVEAEEDADGWYLDLGWKLHPKWELDLRYDRLNRATNDSLKERRFETLTAGVQFFVTRNTRLILNYELREARAPHLPKNNNANRILDGMADRLSLQLLSIF